MSFSAYAEGNARPVIEWSNSDDFELVGQNVIDFDQGLYAETINLDQFTVGSLVGRFEVFQYTYNKIDSNFFSMTSSVYEAVTKLPRFTEISKCGFKQKCPFSILSNLTNFKYHKMHSHNRHVYLETSRFRFDRTSDEQSAYLSGFYSNEGETVHVNFYLGSNGTNLSTTVEIVTQKNQPSLDLKFNLDNLTNAGVVTQVKPDKQGTRSSSYISRFPGARIVAQRDVDSTQLYFAANLDKNNIKIKKISGEYEGTVYEHGSSRISNVHVYQNYIDVLSKADFEILVDCPPFLCGYNSIRNMWAKGLNGNSRFYTTFKAHDGSINNLSLISAKKSINDTNVFIQVFTLVGSRNIAFTFVEIMEEQQPKLGLLEFTEKNMQQEMAEKGRVVLDGLYFAHDATELDLEKSKASLETVQSYLVSNPEAQFYVVGHTDNVGTYEYNMTLSAQRAQAVVQVLSNNFGIEKSRLQAVGVGPVAPAAANTVSTADNRRVELVSKL
tara:strand:- start:22733 stop:24223 length:1491 start_codon:yes stop_codon:yes gene_type:complete